jgi:hypothetical protein
VFTELLPGNTLIKSVKYEDYYHNSLRGFSVGFTDGMEFMKHADELGVGFIPTSSCVQNLLWRIHIHTDRDRNVNAEAYLYFFIKTRKVR